MPGSDPMPPSDDLSNGYESIADRFMAVRSAAGRRVVQAWATSLPKGSSVLDIGAGSGEPLTSALIEAELNVSAIDASPAMVDAFRRRFPRVEIVCEAAEESRFFGKTFDAVLAIGLIFLLPEERQRRLFPGIARALNPRGQLLFSAPHQACSWQDVLTQKTSWSLGIEAYTQLLTDNGLQLSRTYDADGGTHYFEACKLTG